MENTEVLENNTNNQNHSYKDILNQNNGWAIIGLACAISGVNIIGLITSLLGIKNKKNNNGKYLSLAIAGGIISIVHIIRIIIAGFHAFITPVSQGMVPFADALWNFIIEMVTSL